MGKKILWGVLILIAMLFYGIGLVMWENALIAAWIPWTICGGLSLLSGVTLWRLWRHITGSEKFWLNYACHVVFTCGMLFCAFFVINKSFADKTTLHTEKAVVVRKYYKERHKTRRVGRRTYVSGETYKSYYFELQFPTGKLKEISSTTDNYRKTHKGDTIALDVEMGLFHIPIILRKGKTKDVPPSKRYSPPNPFKRKA